VFGARVPKDPAYQLTEGFWCSVITLVNVTVICIAPLFYYIFAFSFGKTEQEDERVVRLEGKKFMLSVTFLLVIIGFQSLAYSQLEGWLYSDAIYFSVQWPVLEPLSLSVHHADETSVPSQ
jgi:potassium channel subfamily K